MMMMSPRARWMPSRTAAPLPRLGVYAITSTPGSRRAISAVPSVDPSLTTMISRSSPRRPRSTARTSASMPAIVRSSLYAGTTIESLAATAFTVPPFAVSVTNRRYSELRVRRARGHCIARRTRARRTRTPERGHLDGRRARAAHRRGAVAHPRAGAEPSLAPRHRAPRARERTLARAQHVQLHVPGLPALPAVPGVPDRGVGRVPGCGVERAQRVDGGRLDVRVATVRPLRGSNPRRRALPPAVDDRALRAPAPDGAAPRSVHDVGVRGRVAGARRVFARPRSGAARGAAHPPRLGEQPPAVPGVVAGAGVVPHRSVAAPRSTARDARRAGARRRAGTHVRDAARLAHRADADAYRADDGGIPRPGRRAPPDLADALRADAGALGRPAHGVGARTRAPARVRLRRRLVAAVAGAGYFRGARAHVLCHRQRGSISARDDPSARRGWHAAARHRSRASAYLRRRRADLDRAPGLRRVEGAGDPSVVGARWHATGARPGDRRLGRDRDRVSPSIPAAGPDVERRRRPRRRRDLLAAGDAGVRGLAPRDLPARVPARGARDRERRRSARARPRSLRRAVGVRAAHAARAA